MTNTKRLLDFYTREVLSKLLPNFRFDPEATIWSVDEFDEKTNILIPSSYSNKCLLNSAYYLPNTTKFIHYTSLASLISILNEGKIRLGPATVMNDPLELSFAKNYLGDSLEDKLAFYIADETEDDVLADNDLKRSTFLFSMSEVFDEQDPDSFDMWRMYGQSGDGVALILNIDSIHRPEWYNCHLSKVHYGINNEIEELKRYLNSHALFQDSNNVVLGNLQKFLRPILALHKSKLYENESEVRLIVKIPEMYIPDSIEAEFSNAISQIKFLSNDKISTGITLQLRNQYKFKNYKHLDSLHIPSISIDKVILGYKHSLKQVMNIQSALDFITNAQDIPQIPVEITNLKKQLGFE